MDQLTLWNSCHLTVLNQGMQLQFHFYVEIDIFYPIIFCCNLERDVIISTNLLGNKAAVSCISEEWNRCRGSGCSQEEFMFKVISSTTKSLKDTDAKNSAFGWRFHRNMETKDNFSFNFLLKNNCSICLNIALWKSINSLKVVWLF